MWRELWEKHQKEVVVTVGMICFLIAGLVVVGLPSPVRRQANARAEVNVTHAESRLVNETPSGGFSSPGFGNEIAATAVSVPEPEPEWILYITGAVRWPGVYSLPPESRLLSLVEAAGGLSIDADPASVNLAAFLQDGLHVHVPERGQEPQAQVQINSAVRGTSVTPGAQPAAGGTSRPGTFPVNINRASAEELTVLRGIGPAIAGNIVEFRTRNGRFHSVDDLLHVTGIGRVRLEQLRNYVTVGP